MGVAADERRALCDLFVELGPEVPTLCGDWTARDLAAHLVLRERRPDAAAGILISAFAARTAKVQRRFAALPWADLVAKVRTGPPTLSPFGIPGVDELVNSTEYFIHHEDVRRAQDGWEPRVPEPTRDAALWKWVGRSGKMTFRRSPVGVVLRRTDGSEVVAKRGPDSVAVVGEPGELLLFAAGRSQARVAFDGDQASIGVVQGLDRAI
jgi:uncharacterized protein (TIGR03085 family)